MGSTDLSRFSNPAFDRGAGALKLYLWYCCNSWLLRSRIPGSGWRASLLRSFGARVGKGTVIKPGVNIKFPWKLQIGDHTWIGENAWIDNLDQVKIGSNCCISQGAYLFCGNHNYKRSTFDLMTQPVTMEDGAWAGAKSVVCPGVTLRSHSVLSAGSVATSDLEAYSIYSGNPAQKIRSREVTE